MTTTPTAAARVSGTIKALDRPRPENSTWTICPETLIALREAAGDQCDDLDLERVEAIALAVEANILATIQPSSAQHVAGSMIKPLDFATVLKHAFLSGVVAARNIPADKPCNSLDLWVEYEPYEPGPYSRILAAIQPDPEPQPVVWQFRAMENGHSRTGWHMAGTNDHAGWVELARRDVTCSIEERPLYATPSGAGTVSVEAAARVLLASSERGGLAVLHDEIRQSVGIRRGVVAEQDVWDGIIAGLRALAGEGGR